MMARKEDNMWQRIKSWWKRHICDDFPYPDVCFDCNRGSAMDVL